MSFGHPAFQPYRELIGTLALERGLPTLAALNELAAAHGVRQSRGLAVSFVAPDGRLGARDYEMQILASGAVPTRVDTWHDVLNALVWLRFPHFKAALNAAHGKAIAEETARQRGRRRDALTMLDESGVWVLSEDTQLAELLRAHAWTQLFCDARRRVEQDMRFVVVGHALLEKALAPYPAMTGKCLVLHTPGFAADAAERLAVGALASVDSPRQLPPLPVQGIPGWDPANAEPRYYANAEVFRPPRSVTL